MKVPKPAFTVSEVIVESWEIVKLRWLQFIGVAAALMVFVIAFLIVMGTLTQAFFLPEWLASILQLVALVFLSGYLLMFGARCLLLIVQHKALDIATAAQPDLPVIGNMLIANILFKIIRGLGTLLLLVPGIIAHVIFQFYMFIVVEKQVSGIAALEQCLALTKGSRLQVFEVQLLLMIICVSTTLTTGLFLVFGVAAFQGEGPFVGIPMTLLIADVVLSLSALLTIFVIMQMMAHAAVGYMYTKMRSRIAKA